MNQTVVINGQQAILTFDRTNGTTTVTFPNVHLDNLNPNDAFGVEITPTQVVPGALMTLAYIPVLLPIPAVR